MPVTARRSVVYPSILGGKNWEAMSFNPQTGWPMPPRFAFGGHYKTEPATYKAGEWYLGMESDRSCGDWPPGDEPRGPSQGRSIPMTGKTKWEQPSAIPRFSGVMSTAGGVVFSGQFDGEF